MKFLSALWLPCIILGVLLMLAGAADPLEGSALILPGSALLATGAWLHSSRYRTFLMGSFGLVFLGIVAMLVISAFGGVGGNSGHSPWWLLFCLPYPAGWLLGLVGFALLMREGWKARHTPLTT